MKYSALMLLAQLCLLSGCTLQTSDSPASEDVGEATQALIEGTWVKPVLTPYSPAISDSSIWVCRGAGIPGRVSGTRCYYTTASGVASSTTDYTNLAITSSVHWEPAWLGRRLGSGIDWYPNPNAPGKVLSANGVGVCEAKSGVTWYPGKYTGGAGGNCKFNNGSAEVTVLSAMNSENVRLLIKP